MICLIQKFIARRRVRDQEIRKLMRKLPVIVGRDADLEAIARMVKGHSFMQRSQRLHSRYLDRKMTYEQWVKYERMLGAREVIVTNNLGTSFKVDRKIISRGINRLRKLVG